MTTPLISIIIPTRNRQKYCLKTIKHIISLGISDMEIVVQDNSDDNSLKDSLVKINKTRIIRYEYIGGSISFVDNFSKALERCQGEYVCMIGDDDTILPNIVNIAQYAKKENIDAVIPQLLTYFWPTDNPIKAQWKTGFLSTLPFRKDKFTEIDPIQSLTKLIRNNFQQYQNLNVPRIYHGLVKRECIEKVKHITGKYFGGLTPDMYMSVCLCFTAPKTVSYSKPFTISGICPTSGSADSATGKHTGELSTAPHFRGHSNYFWIPLVPSIYTVETIWAETGLQALNKMMREEFIRFYSPKDFALILCYKYPQFFERLIEFGKPYGLTYRDIRIYKLKLRMSHFVIRKMEKIKKLLTRNIAKRVYNVSNIEKACEISCLILKI